MYVCDTSIHATQHNDMFVNYNREKKFLLTTKSMLTWSICVLHQKQDDVTPQIRIVLSLFSEGEVIHDKLLVALPKPLAPAKKKKIHWIRPCHLPTVRVHP